MLQIHQVAPAILAQSLGDQSIDLKEFQGKKVLIKFHRFSGCPVARSQIHEFMAHVDQLFASGIETIVFLHSTKQKILPKYEEMAGLHIIPDRQKKYYRLFHSQFSWIKAFSPTSLADTFNAIFKGYLPLFSRFEGGIIGIPSDFLLDEKGRISDMHYGKHLADSWSVEQVLSKI